MILLTLLYVALYTCIATHYMLFALLVGAIPMLFLCEPWYISVPLVVWLLNLMTMPVRCPLTLLENYLRTRIGIPTIKGFVSKHILFREA